MIEVGQLHVVRGIQSAIRGLSWTRTVSPKLKETDAIYSCFDITHQSSFNKSMASESGVKLVREWYQVIYVRLAVGVSMAIAGGRHIHRHLFSGN